MSKYLYCGRCDKYTATQDLYGNQATACLNCGRWAPEIRYCPGCYIEFPVVEEVDGYHSLECKQLSEGSAWADLMEG